MVPLMTALLVVAADQLSKFWIGSYPEGHLIYRAGFLRVAHIQNTGAAFGLFQGQSFALTIVGVVGVILLVFIAFFIRRHFPFLTSLPNIVAFGLMAGGTVGNLTDRLRQGYVTDFLDLGVWPAFNVADSAIVVGVAILVYSILRSTAGEKRRSAG